jgi:hypothetical protein
MASPIYPLPMSFPASGPYPIAVVIDRDGWRFASDLMKRRFNELPTQERLDLRRAFEAQVELALGTPQRREPR